MISLFTTVYTKILDIIAPPFCLSCKKFLETNQVLCVICRKDIKPVVSKEIKLTQKKSMQVLAMGAYEQPLKSLILAKSRSNRAISYQLGNLIWELSYIQNIPFDIIVPVPLHWMRYAWRGYNQTEVIAHAIAQHAQLPVVNLLKRIKHTPYQSYVRADQRMENVKDIFQLIETADQYHNKKILLIDDLMTTGATLHSAAKQLLKLKPEKITAFVAAHVI